MSDGSRAIPAGALGHLNLAAMRRELEEDEARVPHVYQDHLGYFTIGVGRLVDPRKGGRLRDDEIDYLLNNDIAERVAALEARVPAWQAVKDDPARARALVNMAFQLGVDGLLGFKNSLALIEHQAWAEAGRNLRKSKWYKQTPKRAERVIRAIETGKDRGA